MSYSFEIDYRKELIDLVKESNETHHQILVELNEKEKISEAIKKINRRFTIELDFVHEEQFDLLINKKSWDAYMTFRSYLDQNKYNNVASKAKALLEYYITLPSGESLGKLMLGEFIDDLRAETSDDNALIVNLERYYKVFYGKTKKLYKLISDNIDKLENEYRSHKQYVYDANKLFINYIDKQLNPILFRLNNRISSFKDINNSMSHGLNYIMRLANGVFLDPEDIYDSVKTEQVVEDK